MIPVEDVAAAAMRARRWVDVATWVAIALGLGFTAVNVQVFAAAGAAHWSPGWVVAWLLDPMVSVLLLAVVRAEQVTARWQVQMPWRVTAVKWAAFAATYLMNTWSAWRDGIPSAVVLHSVPPVFVLLAAEVAPALRQKLIEAVEAATAHTAGSQTASNPLAASYPRSDSRSPQVMDLNHPEGGSARSEVSAAQVESAPTVGQRPTDDQPSSLPRASAAPGSSQVQVNDLDRPESGAGPGEDDTDPRVREIADLLTAGCDVTGPQVAALNGVSDRTGRRLLADARARLENHPIRPDLHLVEARTSGGTA